MKRAPVSRRHRLRRSIEKTWPDLGRLITGRAPRFVYGGRLDHVPVFTYHRVDERFEDDLRFLAEAGYRTVLTAELDAWRRGDWRPDGRSLLLTFDDGDRSLRDVALPLLRRYDFRALAFVVCGLTPADSDDRLVGWSDLREAIDEGRLEVGPHSMWHHHVAVAPRLLGFVTPETDRRFVADIPVPRVDGSESVRIGAPFLAGAPRYLCRRAWIPDAAALQRTVDRVGEDGARAMQDTARRREVERDLRDHGCYETDDEADARIIDDMQRSMATIERQAPNPASGHLAYPWYAGDARTDRLARVAGVERVFLGVDRRSGAATDDLPDRIGRLPEQWLRALPGRNRQGWTRLLGVRVSRLLRPRRA